MGIYFLIYDLLIRDHSFKKAKRATCTKTGSRNKIQITTTTKTATCNVYGRVEQQSNYKLKLF